MHVNATEYVCVAFTTQDEEGFRGHVRIVKQCNRTIWFEEWLGIQKYNS